MSTFTPTGLEDFDPTKEYGVISSEPVSLEYLVGHAREFLPPGTPFKVLETKRWKQKAWYFSPSGKIPNPEKVTCIGEFVA